MVACVIICVAAQDIKNKTGKQLGECFLRVVETMPDNFGKRFIGVITRHHVIETEKCQRRNHGFARPATCGFFTIKSFDQKNVLVCCLHKLYWGGIYSSNGGESHSDEFSLHHAI